MKNPLLTIENLEVTFPNRRGDFVAVTDFNLTLDEGEIVGLIGESGAGKSTVGNAVIGLIDSGGGMSKGGIWLRDCRIDELSAKKRSLLCGREISMIFQDPQTSLNPLMTIGDHLIETICWHTKEDEDKTRERALALLREVEIEDPEKRINEYPHQFSGGMRQRVVIALALCTSPALIIADEPTTALDVSVQATILELLRKLCKKHRMGMLIITHNMGVIAHIADRVAVMYKSRQVETGTTAQVLRNPEHEYTRGLLSAVPRADITLPRFPGVCYGEEEKHSNANTILSLWSREETHNKTRPLLEVNDLRISFITRDSLFKRFRKTFTAVDGVSFKIDQGEVFGLVGGSGSGKSTIARMVVGLEKPSSGKIFFEGKDISILKAQKRQETLNRKIQMVFQDPYSSLNPRMTIRKIIAEPILFYKLAATKQEAEEQVKTLLDYVKIDYLQSRNKFPHEFSGGQRQRISLARALAAKPSLLICDEPTSSLDVSIQAQILNLLMDLRDDFNISMLFISHDMPVIRQMCDRIGVMKSGQLCEVGEKEELFSNPQHEYTKTLSSYILGIESCVAR